MKKSYAAKRFQDFAEQCHDTSPLYEELSSNIARDEEILTLCAYTKKGQPVPNLLFAAVQYLLMKGKKHPLADFYASYVDKPKDIAHSYPHFKDFCLKFKDDIVPLLQTKNVQTNEVRRCAYLYPCFCYMYEITQKPIALIEIGTSAGLQLLWDQYSYSYGTNQIYGNQQAEVHLQSEIIGPVPSLRPISPPVLKRIGVDLHINDVTNDEDLQWLKSLIWPEHSDEGNYLRKLRKF
ncbi:hypothetical protein SAMN05421676_105199 [Salinibacillus kushneri]|uniref:DUF2332 domain-containing protein n=1 Tax=Salinibacillus kushneri TaxID=237682 RepID=A0A1I0F4H4_9BACI|nr:hypothetical protein SAMN05421676_105199 [Salinibacillus kushneri]